MKIMIIGAHPSGNKGAEAMLIVLVKKLTEKIPDVSFIFESLTAEEDFTFFKINKYKFTTICFNAKKFFSPYGSNLNDVDYVIDIGGLAYTDKSLKDNLRSFIKHFSIILRKKKLIYFTQDFGPARKLHTRLLGKIVFSYSYKIFSRSEFTYDVLANVLSIPKDKLLGPFPDSTLSLMADSSNVLTKENYVVISPSAILYNREGEEYINLISNLINKISINHKVYLVVHTFTNNGRVSDAMVIDEILKVNNKAEKIELNITPMGLKGIFSRAQYVISSRYHVIVGSVSSNVPAIAIGWNEKYNSFLKLYGMTENNIQFNNDSYNVISALIDYYELNTVSTKLTLKEKNKNLKPRTEDSFNLLVSFIK